MARNFFNSGYYIAGAQNLTWPKEIPFTKSTGKVIIYQPQPDVLEGNTLTGRAAIAAKEKSTDELVFGAVFFEAKLLTDRGTRVATLESIKITNAKIGGADDADKLSRLITFLKSEIPKWDMDLSLVQLRSKRKKKLIKAVTY